MCDIIIPFLGLNTQDFSLGVLLQSIGDCKFKIKQVCLTFRVGRFLVSVVTWRGCDSL